MNIDDSMINSSIANAQQQNSQQTRTLRESVTLAMQAYFHHLDDQEVVDVYQMVMNEVEAPLLEEVMRYTRNNQTKASEMLGLNRGTLRKKLKQYDLL
jgi:Fis family transcriptional regulator